MGPVVGRGVLLDVAGVRGGPLHDGAVISPRDLEQATRQSGIAVGKGDIVLVRTGWEEHQGRADSVSFDGEPGLDLDAALWLAEREIAALGADNFAVEVIPFAQGAVFPVHQRLIRDFGVPLLEGLLLHELAATGCCEFMFVASPLPVVGGTGSPINPIAIL
jgi:kynurenine formamidase